MFRVFMVFVFLAVSGCATKYQPTGFTGGFNETQLGENIFQVTFNGNGYTGRERATDFALLRSAEVTLLNGFRFFIVAGSDKDSSISAYTTPSTSTTTGSAYRSGNNVYGTARTNTTGGQTYIVSKPGVSNTIVCFKDKPDTGGLVYDAEFVRKSLKAKYSID